MGSQHRAGPAGQGAAPHLCSAVGRAQLEHCAQCGAPQLQAEWEVLGEAPRGCGESWNTSGRALTTLGAGASFTVGKGEGIQDSFPPFCLESLGRMLNSAG